MLAAMPWRIGGTDTRKLQAYLGHRSIQIQSTVPLLRRGNVFLFVSAIVSTLGMAISPKVPTSSQFRGADVPKQMAVNR